jgi:hypothetical protein
MRLPGGILRATGAIVLSEMRTLYLSPDVA